MSETKFELMQFDEQTEKRLAIRKKNISVYARGVFAGAAQLYGYAFLCGREMLLAKSEIPHGNKDSEKGFTAWLEQNFDGITVRTARNWMSFATQIHEKTETVSFFSSAGLDLKKRSITKRDRSTILEIIPELMDGKGMMQFMRDSKLLRDPQKPQHHPRKPVDPEAALRKVSDRAKEHMLDAERPVIMLIDSGDIQEVVCRKSLEGTLATFVQASNAIRERLKCMKGQ